MSTAPVFAALGLRHGERCPARPASAAVPDERDALLRWLAAGRNDLEAPAISIAPAIAEVLRMIGTLPGCRLARMSGSGSACFGLFDDEEAAASAAGRLAKAQTGWWVRASSIGG
jgi:4-diphosphocytidyl-2-C-methyl-D-erythritol kinase